MSIDNIQISQPTKQYFITERSWFSSRIVEVSKRAFIAHRQRQQSSWLDAPKSIGLLLLGSMGVACAQQYQPPGFVPELTDSQVNTYVVGQQTEPAVAALVNDTAVILWNSQNQDGDAGGIYAQRVAEDGGSVGKELSINSRKTRNQFSPCATGTLDGGFAAGWTSNREDNSNLGIAGRVFRNNGSPKRGNFVVNNYKPNAQEEVRVATLENGDLMYVWKTWSKDPDPNQGLSGRRFTPNGDPIGDEFQIHVDTSGKQEKPVVAALPGGGFAVAWETVWGVNSPRHLTMRLFYADGTQSAEIKIHTSIVQEVTPDLVCMENGLCIVIWRARNSTSTGSDIFGQVVTQAGKKVGSRFRINNDVSGYRNSPSLDAYKDTLVAAWEATTQDQGGPGIFGRLIAGNGTMLGKEFLINVYRSGAQRNPRVKFFTSGAFIAAWESSGQDGNQTGIFQRIYHVAPSPLTTTLLESTSSSPSRLTSTVLSTGVSLSSNLAQTLPNIAQTAGATPSLVDASGFPSFTATASEGGSSQLLAGSSAVESTSVTELHSRESLPTVTTALLLTKSEEDPTPLYVGVSAAFVVLCVLGVCAEVYHLRNKKKGDVMELDPASPESSHRHSEYASFSRIESPSDHYTKPPAPEVLGTGEYAAFPSQPSENEGSHYKGNDFMQKENDYQEAKQVV